ncbi:MAG TPA: PBP1A family penicillin-binding protein [Blastocatellia bacterium]|nr:PBP1A family penicillin-binding protein [Blastocatellia bacterium]
MSSAPRREPNFIQRFFRRQTFLALLVLTIVAGGLTGLVVAKQIDLTDEAQQVTHLQDYRPDVVSRVYAEDGKTVIGEFSLERRIPLQSDEIPLKMKQAFLAIEDARFYQHVGLDPVRVVGALFHDVIRSKKEGGSTITQQLARNLFLSPEQTWTRKIREALISLEIERYYTKEQILTMYCNQIFLGGGAYGVEAASQYYFGKHVKDLDVSQMAVLASLPKSPTHFNPLTHPKEATQRRNLVIDSMVDQGFISSAEADAAKAKPLELSSGPKVTNNDLPYAYFTEEIRKELEHGPIGAKYNIHQDGLNIYTTLDAEWQKIAEKSVRFGLHDYDHRHRRWRGNLYNVIDSDGVKDLNSYQHADWVDKPEVGDYMTGLITGVSPKGADVRMGEYKALVTDKDTAWTQKTPISLFKRGDLGVFQIKAVNEKDKTVNVALDQIPAVQGALIAIDVKTGEVRAMVGGYDFNTNKFNNATQANRQTGSAFKPFIYTTAIENGFTPDDIIDDAPFQRGDWAPHNYDNSFKGPIPLRLALAESRNIPAVKLLDAVGIQKAVKMVQRFGLPNPMAPYLPSALGATEEPLISMVSAYSTFPNRGIRMEPHYIKKITDRYGQVIFEAKPEGTKVISPYVAGQMVSLMQGVVQFGTAGSLKSRYRGLAKWPIAGKTGTVNDFTDAWFVGYTPQLAVGTWIGYSGEKRSLGHGETGATGALPMWGRFVEPILKDKTPVDFPKIGELDEETKVAQAKARKENADRLAKENGDKTPEELKEDAKKAMDDATKNKGTDTEAPKDDKKTKNDDTTTDTPTPIKTPDSKADGGTKTDSTPANGRSRSGTDQPTKPTPPKTDDKSKDAKKPGLLKRIFGGGKKPDKPGN